LLTIRLQRRGKVHEPFFHVVAADSRKAVKGAFIERLGYYDPKQSPSIYKIDQERLQHWFGMGATLSSAVANIVKKQKITLTRNIIRSSKTTKAKK
jgi:small subunit ribosomal protein S16